jgi:uncharacterized membrane protein
MNSPSDQNRYQPPSSDVTPPVEDRGMELINGGQSVPAGNGVTWISSGWQLFIKAPGIWILCMFILLGLSVVLVFVPLIGSLASNLLMPVMIGGIMLGCRSLDEGGTLQVDHLFAGFKERAGPLVIVGLIMLGATIAVLMVTIVIVVVMFGTSIFQAFGDEQALASLFGPQGLLMLAFAVLLFMALIVPLLMAYWFAPALVVFHNLDPVSALKQSFLGCTRNMMPFLLYGIVFLLLGIAALIPVGLGLLVIFPLSYASMYSAYKDIYLQH